MKNLNELTERQLELRLSKAYDSSNYELVERIEEEQRLRYVNWEKQLAKKKTNELTEHIYIGDFEGVEYKKVMSFTSKGSRTRYYIGGVEVRNEKRSKAKSIIFHLQINKKLNIKNPQEINQEGLLF